MFDALDLHTDEKVHPDVQNEHLRLSDLIENISLEIAKTPRSQDGVVCALEDLLFGAKSHFKHEETIMDREGYPNKDRHALDHKYLEQSLSDYIRLYQSGMISLNTDSGPSLKSWLNHHIKKWDFEFCEWSRTHGGS